MNSRNKLTRIGALVFALCITAAAGVAGAIAPEVTLDGVGYGGAVKLRDGVTYVRLREFSEGEGSSVAWDAGSGTAYVSRSGISLSARRGDSHVTVNGVTVDAGGSIFIEENRMYIPIRPIGAAFGYDTVWDGERFSVALSRVGYTEDDVYWLSRIISAEARGESFEGKLAVGTVVLNRVASELFPSTVYGVIFDRAGGVQFSPVINGTIYNEPDSDSVTAARMCLSGTRVGGGVLFFLNRSKAESQWITNNRQYVMTIGNHEFYA